MRTPLVVGLAVAALTCRSSAPSPPPRPSMIDERQACSADADCAVVELACCDRCNGDAVAGVHRDFAGDVRRDYAGSCAAVACIRRACVETPAAVCERGMCAVRIGDQVNAAPLPRP